MFHKHHGLPDTDTSSGDRRRKTSAQRAAPGVLKESNSHLTFLRAGPLAPMDGHRCPTEPFPEVRPRGSSADPEDSRRSVLQALGRRDGALPRRHSGAPGCSAVSRSPVRKPGLPRKRRCAARADVPRALRNALRNRSGLAPTARTWRGFGASRTAAPPRPASPHPAARSSERGGAARRRYGLGQSGGGAALGAGALVGAGVVAAERPGGVP